MRLPVVLIMSLAVAGVAFVATAFTVGATLNALNALNASLLAPLAVAFAVFLLAYYLSAKRARNAPRRPLGEEAGDGSEQLKHAAATPSNRQSANNPSA